MRFLRIIIAVIVAIGSLIAYYTNTEKNPVTGEEQHIGITVEQEIALGLQSVPEMSAQFGGMHPSQEYQDLVDQVGNRIVDKTLADRSPYKFEFYVLADEQT